tara:strand:- start:49 stop:675 length:627 start_codon:yes stop_codon:yes gene_type:complete
MIDPPIKVIDNFLPEECFRHMGYNLMTTDSYRCHDFTVKDSEADGSIEWFGERNTNPDPVRFHEILFSFQLYSRRHNKEVIQDLYHLLKKEFTTLEETLNVKELLLLRANCTHALPQNYASKWHTDLGTHPKAEKSKTCILYLNRNNGGTKIKVGDRVEFVKSEPNRAVIFAGTLEHAGVWCTDRKLRFVLNINYVPNEENDKTKSNS